MRLPIATALAALSATTAFAHPHVFADTTVSFLTTDGQLSALRVTWRYDEFTTLLMYDLLALDEDGDGELDQTDFDKVVVGETDWPPDYNGDLHLTTAGQPMDLTRPQNTSAGMTDHRIHVSFDIPLAQPQPIAGLTASLKVYDPFYYYAYTVMPEIGVDTADCTTTLIPFAPDPEDLELQAQLALLSRDETPAQEGVGALFADEVILTCPD